MSIAKGDLVIVRQGSDRGFFNTVTPFVGRIGVVAFVSDLTRSYAVDIPAAGRVFYREDEVCKTAAQELIDEYRR